ncbi:hypothetical protein NONO_c59770 [Nocardia nova SH22a]|uniref:DNA-binding protein n=1 Tax=Nocardia nova SH22a TaxID=1415166 RepID=W5TP73_9NOCA|nr:hypothetical protein [Nocardia nova]AHH20753.1 hypothetical protein NONO_c59770 [Nocardia nova SH22a]
MSDPVETDVDKRPLSFDLAGAIAYTGLSKFRLNELAREEKIVVRKDGTKNLFMRASLDRYVQSLPVREAS